MRIPRLLLLMMLIASLGAAATADAQGPAPRPPARQSFRNPTRFARPVFNPFNACSRSRLSATRFGLPSLENPSAPSAPTPAAEIINEPAPVVAPELPIVGGSSFSVLDVVQPPTRPSVRSPFRPAPRPDF